VGTQDTQNQLNEQQAQTIGRDVRDRVSRELDQKFQSRSGGQVNTSEIREFLQQVDFGRHIRESLTQSSMQRESSSAKT
jgi:hypothetical protein